ncbi:hypothetical protein ARB_03863 [Paecilomyces variotii No. 5]|uniref:Uncharacterized protein n=1 Tax=Byssochlamys spectabilis (strain No. 5 / NBRC 109023) TaxID=1356009 RepID=V5GC14_BYSSN|nr:hypothetical protein ARB_03863 [Paecilomyces variotii No. 5]
MEATAGGMQNFTTQLVRDVISMSMWSCTDYTLHTDPSAAMIQMMIGLGLKVFGGVLDISQILQKRPGMMNASWLNTCTASRDIIVDNLPPCLIVPQFHVTGSAIHQLKFMGALKRWSSFQLETRQQFNAIDWEAHAAYLDATAVDSATNEHNLRLEQYSCGEEVTSNGRFVQHVLHVSSAIAREIGSPATSGDWNSSILALASS